MARFFIFAFLEGTMEGIDPINDGLGSFLCVFPAAPSLFIQGLGKKTSPWYPKYRPI
jgi:hypothetical protein